MPYVGALLLITMELQPDSFCKFHLFAVERRADVFLCKQICLNTLHYSAEISDISFLPLFSRFKIRTRANALDWNFFCSFAFMEL